MNNTVIILETLSISALNVAAVYIAAISYELRWSEVTMFMVLSSIITAGLTRFILSKMTKRDMASTRMDTIMSILVIALFSSLAVFTILIYRFNVPMALGISLLSGILTSFIRHIIN
jgi:fructose-specific phosphotransferase system IIC component